MEDERECYGVVWYWANKDGTMNQVSWAKCRGVFYKPAAADWEARPRPNDYKKRRIAVWPLAYGQVEPLLFADNLRGKAFLALCDSLGVKIPEGVR